MNFSEIKEGVDIGGNIVEEIYYIDTENKYVIFKVANRRVLMYYYDKYMNYNNKLSDISIQLAKISNMLVKRKSDIKIYFPQTARAIKECFDGNTAVAQCLLCDIEVSIVETVTRKCKLCYLVTSGLFVILNIITAIIVGLKMLIPAYLNLVYAAVFGSIGGLISVSYKSKDFSINPSEDEKIFIFNGLLRVFISMLAGILGYYFINSDLVKIFKNNPNYFTIFIFCTLAGFSEKFIPNVLNSIENNTNNKLNPEKGSNAADSNSGDNSSQ